MDFILLVLIPSIILLMVTAVSIFVMIKNPNNNNKVHRVSYQTRRIKDKNHKDTETNKLLVAESDEKFNNDMICFIKTSLNTKE